MSLERTPAAFTLKGKCLGRDPVTKKTILNTLWAWAGKVPLRQKIVGIIVAPLLILGFTIAWWVSSQLGGWLSYLLSEQRVAQAMAVGMRSVFIITLFAALAGLGIGYVMAWVLTRPVLDMTYIARRAKDGDLSVRAPVWANDEIGELGRAFNDMIASLDTSYRDLERSNSQLQHRNEELAILYRLADMANKPYTVGEVSQYGLHQALDNTNAAAGLVVLMNGKGPFCNAQHQVTPAFVEAVIAALEGADLARVEAAQAGGLVVLDGESATAGGFSPALMDACRALGCQALVIAPLLVKKGGVGAMVLAYADVSGLREHDQQLVHAICNQLGVTVQNSQLWDELHKKEQLRAQLLNKVVSAQEDERQRISRELHDETGQALTSLLVQLKILERGQTVADMRSHVAGIRQLVQNTLQEVRRLAADLRPAALDDLGLVSAVDGYIHDYAHKSDIHVDFQPGDVDGVRLPRDVEIVLYRVIQEAMTNIVRHAHATEAQVVIERDERHIRVSIADNGCGFDLAAVYESNQRGLGLLGMRERVELLGGNLRLDSLPGQGTRVDVELLLSDNAMLREVIR